ncbi:MAG: putative Ig domain-containing protein [Nitrospirota bacterium]|nr:putative Ig domain-containing protein [Nitrospirota bacterium]
MKHIAATVSTLILGLSLFSCSGGGSGAGGGNPQTFAVSTTSATYGVVGNAYSSTLAATGGTAPFTWTLFGGTLPSGLSLNAGTGVVSGTPTGEGNVTAVLTVRDGTGKTATGSVLFAVHPRTDRVSVDSTGVAGSGASSAPSINSDGSLVAFTSQAANFVAGVSGSQIYLHNRQTNQIEVVSRDSTTTIVISGNGGSSAPSISSDGSLVAFVSLATNLVTGVSGQQIYVRNRQTGQTSVISKSSAGVAGTGISSAPAISADGRYVAFVSASTNLVSGVSGTQVYVHDRQTGQTTLVSKDNNLTPIPGNDNSSTPTISSDGQFVAFASLSTNLGAAGGNRQIYVHDRLNGPNGTTSLVSKDSAGTVGNGNSSVPSISGDGRYVAFVSGATNIVAGFSGQQVYIHDRNTGPNGTNSLISRDNSGTPNAGNQNSNTPSISADGRYVAFVSASTNLIALISGQQVYLHDRTGPTTSLVSRDNTSGSVVAGDAASDIPAMNGSGGFVAFASLASNLGTGGGQHTYVRALP